MKIAKSAMTGDDLILPTSAAQSSAAAAATKAACRPYRMALGKRAAIGKDWDGSPANDNANWPLAKALLAEGNHDLLKYAIAYRMTYEAAKSEVAIGLNGTPSPKMVVLRRTTIDESTGNITYGGEIVSKAASVDIPATMARPTNADSKKNATPVPKPWNGDSQINNAIDARGKLAWLQGKVGAILDPFEMAVIDGATLQEVGNAAGVAARSGAMAAGRAICHMGLIAVRDAMGKVDRRDLAA